MAKHILVVGSINMDLTITAPRQPRMGETLTGGGFRTSPGGKGANQAAACALLGAEVRMLGCVGNDIYGDELISSLTEKGVDCDAVSRAGCSTGVAVITVVDGDNCIVLDEGANGRVTEEMITEHEALFKWADAVLLQLEIPLGAVLAAARLGKKHGAQVVINPAPMKKLPPEAAQLSDWFMPNRSEAELFLGHEIASPEKAAQELRERGARNVLITLGSKGSIALTDEGLSRYGIYNVETVDTTAAGDSFIAGFTVCDGTTDERLRYASAVSAIAVGRRGAQSSLPTAAEVESFLKERDK